MTLKIKLSEHRKAFRIGSMRVETLSADADGRSIEFIVDEDIEPQQLQAVEKWYFDAGAEAFVIKQSMARPLHS